MREPEQCNGEAGLGPNGRSGREGAGHVEKQRQGSHVVDHIKVPDMESVPQLGRPAEHCRFDDKTDLQKGPELVINS